MLQHLRDLRLTNVPIVFGKIRRVEVYIFTHVSTDLITLIFRITLPKRSDYLHFASLCLSVSDFTNRHPTLQLHKPSHIIHLRLRIRISPQFFLNPQFLQAMNKFVGNGDIKPCFLILRSRHERLLVLGDGRLNPKTHLLIPTKTDDFRATEPGSKFWRR